MRWLVVGMAVLSGAMLVTAAQTQPPARKPPVRRPAPPPPPPPPEPLPPETIAPDMTCPTPLGVGVKTKRTFCDVMTGRIPAEGVIVILPPHEGSVTLTFDLHNRQTYSDEQVKANRAYARYTATIGVMTADNTLISRAVVQSEFRTAA